MTYNDMKDFKIIELEQNLEEANKQVEHYKKIAEKTGNLCLRETEDLSKLICLHKQAREALQESEEKLRNIIEHSNEIFYVHDREHKFLYVSPKSEEILGYTPEEMMISHRYLKSFTGVWKQHLSSRSAR